MGQRFLANLLQTKIRNHKNLAQIETKRGPRLQAYAAVTAQRLPIKPKPKRIAPLQPMINTQYPSSRCLAAATILATTDQKYTDKIEAKTRNKSVEDYAKQLPESLRTRFIQIHATITEGKPNHQVARGCPLSSNAEKRLAFQQVAPNKLPDEQRKKIYPPLVQACKLRNVCARCGRPRRARNEQQHKHCSAYTKTCPPKRTAACLANTCEHPRHEVPTIWQTEDLSIQVVGKLLPTTQYHPFCWVSLGLVLSPLPYPPNVSEPHLHPVRRYGQPHRQVHPPPHPHEVCENTTPIPYRNTS